MIIFTEINSFAYLSQNCQGLNYISFNIAISILVTKTLSFGTDLFSKILILVYRYGQPNSDAQKAHSSHLPFFTLTFSINALTFLHFNTDQSLF